MTNLVGMFLVLYSIDHAYLNTGEIVGVAGNSYIIQFDKLDAAHPPRPLEVHTAEELSDICQCCGLKVANMFKTRAEMDSWLDWMNRPQTPPEPRGKIVQLKKPH